MRGLAFDLDAVVADTRPLWLAWLEDAARRLRLQLPAGDDRVAAVSVLDEGAGNWRALLERFAEDHAGVYLRPDPAVNAALRRLRAGGATLVAYTDGPEELARVAAAQLGVARLLEALECGAGARERALGRIGPGGLAVATRDEFLARA